MFQRRSGTPSRHQRGCDGEGQNSRRLVMRGVTRTLIVRLAVMFIISTGCGTWAHADGDLPSPIEPSLAEPGDWAADFNDAQVACYNGSMSACDFDLFKQSGLVRHLPAQLWAQLWRPRESRRVTPRRVRPPTYPLHRDLPRARMIGSKRILASIGASGPARASGRTGPAASPRTEWFTIGEVPLEAASFRTAGDRAGWLRDASRRLAWPRTRPTRETRRLRWGNAFRLSGRD